MEGPPRFGVERGKELEQIDILLLEVNEVSGLPEKIEPKEEYQCKGGGRGERNCNSFFIPLLTMDNASGCLRPKVLPRFEVKLVVLIV